MSELSAAEQSCLAENVDPQQVMALLGGGLVSPEETTALIQCLEDETLLRLFLTGLIGQTEPLSAESSVCVRSGFANFDLRSVMLALATPAESEEAAAMEGFMAAGFLLTLSCLNDEEWQVVDPAVGMGAEHRDGLRCVLAELGGPAGLAAALQHGVDPTTAFEASEACKSTGSTPAPTSTPTPRPTATPTPRPTPTLTPTPTTMATSDLATVVERVRSSVVRVSTASGTGSGVIVEVESNGSAVVVTNYHVIDDGGAVDVLVNDSDRYSATVLGFDASKDLAVLRICCSADFGASSLSSGTELADGSTVFTMGYPLGVGRATVTRGIVSSSWFDRQAGRWMVQTDAAINPGNSGGPLFTLDGQVVGINTSVVRDAGAGFSIEGFGFAVWARTVRASLPAMMIGSRLGATPEPTPGPTPTSGADFGPVDGVLQDEPDNLIETLHARIDVDDFSAVATFDNPSNAKWDYGFLFRYSQHRFHVLVIDESGYWSHKVRGQGNGESNQLLDSGRASSFLSGDLNANEIRILALGDEGWFFLNGEFVAELDLSSGDSTGDVAVISGYFRSNDVTTKSIPFRGFAVRASEFLGDEGGLEHQDDDLIKQSYLDVDAADFAIQSTFTNPYGQNIGAWDYGVAFRDSSSDPNTFHAVTLSSNGTWGYHVREGSATPIHRESGRLSVNAAAGGTNRLLLLAVGDTGLFYVNGAFVTELDISRGPSSGRIGVGTGFYTGDERPGHSTGYDYRVWSLDSSQAAPPARERFTAISSGGSHTCALREDGSPVCWGSDRSGQSSPPARQRFAAISSGTVHTCALRADGSPVCWGRNTSGVTSPPAQERFTTISSGGSHTCALREDSSPVCWGDDQEGHASPPEQERFTTISSGLSHTCALREDGSPVCWGSDWAGQSSPPQGERFTSISSGFFHTCALREDGSPVCWGSDQNGQASPPLGERLTLLSSGQTYTCALREDGSPICWGSYALPPQGESFTVLSTGSEGHTCALREDGSPVCWGYNNEYGQATPP